MPRKKRSYFPKSAKPKEKVNKISIDIEIDIQDLTHEGKGVGQHNGKTVFLKVLYQGRKSKPIFSSKKRITMRRS